MSKRISLWDYLAGRDLPKSQKIQRRPISFAIKIDPGDAWIDLPIEALFRRRRSTPCRRSRPSGSGADETCSGRVFSGETQ